MPCANNYWLSKVILSSHLYAFTRKEERNMIQLQSWSYFLPSRIAPQWRTNSSWPLVIRKSIFVAEPETGAWTETYLFSKLKNNFRYWQYTKKKKIWIEILKEVINIEQEPVVQNLCQGWTCPQADPNKRNVRILTSIKGIRSLHAWPSF